MRKILGLLLAAMLVASSCGGDAEAGKPSFGGGSGGRSSFSGGSRPSFGGGSKPSFSGGSTPSFSGGGKSAASPPKFSGGSTPHTTPHTTNSPTNKPAFGGGSTSPPRVVTTTPIAGRTPTSVSKKPVAESFDKLSGTEARKIESRRAYEKSTAPAPSYKTPSGTTVNINPQSKSTAYLRGRLDEAHWQTRYQRTDVFYGGYYSRYPMGVGFVYYHDYYHPYWNYWLLSQTLDVTSLWIYHHQLEMMRQDPARLNYLYSQNAELKARVAALERQGIPRDETYTPRGVDPDIMYNDGYVNAVYNPRPKEVDHYEYDDAGESHVGTALLWIFVIIPVSIGLLFCLYWFVFRHRY